MLPAIYEAQAPDMRLGFFVHQPQGCACIIATGYMLHTALQVVKELKTKGHEVALIDLFDLAKFDLLSLKEVISQYRAIVSMEEGFSGRGGLDALLFDFIANQELNIPMLNIGVEAAYRFELGTRKELHERVGIGPKVAMKRIENFLNLHSL